MGVRKEIRLRVETLVCEQYAKKSKRERNEYKVIGVKTTRATHFRSCPVMPALLTKASQAKCLCIGY